MAYWATRGLRGSAFEELIGLTNKLYLRSGLAVIQKVPTPITPVEVNNRLHTITSAYFEQKSTVDFIGVAGGLALCFDAKETKYKNLPVRNIHAHQIEFMDAFQRQRGVSFLLVQFHFTGEIFLLPFPELYRYHRDSERGGRKSIPYSVFEKRYLVENKKGYPVHYLDAVSRYTADLTGRSI